MTERLVRLFCTSIIWKIDIRYNMESEFQVWLNANYLNGAQPDGVGATPEEAIQKAIATLEPELPPPPPPAKQPCSCAHCQQIAEGETVCWCQHCKEQSRKS